MIALSFLECIACFLTRSALVVLVPSLSCVGAPLALWCDDFVGVKIFHVASAALSLNRRLGNDFWSLLDCTRDRTALLQAEPQSEMRQTKCGQRS
jgi:hypothetical protein